MGAAGSALSLAIDVTPSTRANPEESVFVTAMMTSGPLESATVRFLSTTGLGRLQAASPTLRMHEAIVEHMRTAKNIATLARFRRIIADSAVNARLWLMLRPRDMDRMTGTGAYGLYPPEHPGEAWECREEDNQAFSRHIARLIMKDIRENREFAERQSAKATGSAACTRSESGNRCGQQQPPPHAEQHVLPPPPSPLPPMPPMPDRTLLSE